MDCCTKTTLLQFLCGYPMGIVIECLSCLWTQADFYHNPFFAKEESYEIHMKRSKKNYKFFKKFLIIIESLYRGGEWLFLSTGKKIQWLSPYLAFDMQRCKLLLSWVKKTTGKGHCSQPGITWFSMFDQLVIL